MLRDRFGQSIHLIENGANIGTSAGWNKGIRYALNVLQADYVLLLNNDTLVEPYFLTHMVSAGEAGPEVGMVGAVIYDGQDRKRVRSAGARIRWNRGMISLLPMPTPEEQSAGSREVEFIDGCCMLVKRRLIETVGLLDTQYFAYSEEADWCVRARRAGFRLTYALNARIWHKAPHSYYDGHRLYYFLRSNVLFMRKNATTTQLLTFLPYFLALSLPSYIAKPFFRHPGSTISAVCRAMAWNLLHRPSRSSLSLD